jgi:hypothetical protein
MMWLSLIKSSEGLNWNFSTKSQIWIMHMFQCFDHNFWFRYWIAMKLVALER